MRPTFHQVMDDIINPIDLEEQMPGQPTLSPSEFDTLLSGRGAVEEACVVCLEGMLETKVVRFPCGHCLHALCACKHLMSTSRRCPTCRQEAVPSLDPEEVVGSDGDEGSGVEGEVEYDSSHDDEDYDGDT